MNFKNYQTPLSFAPFKEKYFWIQCPTFSQNCTFSLDFASLCERTLTFPLPPLCNSRGGNSKGFDLQVFFHPKVFDAILTCWTCLRSRVGGIENCSDKLLLHLNCPFACLSRGDFFITFCQNHYTHSTECYLRCEKSAILGRFVLFVNKSMVFVWSGTKNVVI